MTRRVKSILSGERRGPTPVVFPWRDGVEPTLAASQPHTGSFSKTPRAIWFDRDPRLTNAAKVCMGAICSFAKTWEQDGKAFVAVEIRQTKLAAKMGVKPQSVNEWVVSYEERNRDVVYVFSIAGFISHPLASSVMEFTIGVRQQTGGT